MSESSLNDKNIRSNNNTLNSREYIDIKEPITINVELNYPDKPILTNITQTNKHIIEQDNKDNLLNNQQQLNIFDNIENYKVKNQDNNNTSIFHYKALKKIINNNKSEIRNIEDNNNSNNIFLTAGVATNLNNINESLKKDLNNLYTYHDLIIPGGKNARLCIIHNPLLIYNKMEFEIAEHYKFLKPTPVVNLIGANTNNKGKIMAGISRAVKNTDSIVVDSGIHTGIEIFCLRKNITLIGVAPEYMIELPKPNSDNFSQKKLTNGHTHFIILGNNDNRINWGGEAKFKVGFIERILIGIKEHNYKCKTVGIVLGNIENCIDEILYVREFYFFKYNISMLKNNIL